MESEEIWKDIPDYEGFYQVSNIGRVKGLKRTIYRKYDNAYMTRKEKIMKPRLSKKNGYLKVELSNETIKRKNIPVHRLVMTAFHGKSNLHVDHIDGNKLNNKLDNLRYVTNRQNQILYNLGKTSQTGITGVVFCTYTNRYRAFFRYTINGVKNRIELGRFDTPEEAALARRNKEIELGLYSELTDTIKNRR